MGRLQFWLQGHGYPPPYRPWIAVWLGNRISTLRYWTWRIERRRFPCYCAETSTRNCPRHSE